jgi:hypothetical protein
MAAVVEGGGTRETGRCVGVIVAAGEHDERQRAPPSACRGPVTRLNGAAGRSPPSCSRAALA